MKGLPLTRNWQEDQPRLAEFLRERVPSPRVFATLSGGDLCGFPSDDRDYDLPEKTALPV